jgi:hypothetical protein
MIAFQERGRRRPRVSMEGSKVQQQADERPRF